MPAKTPRPPAVAPSPGAMMRAMTVLAGLKDQLLAIDPTIVEDEKLYADMLEGEGGDALDVLARVVRASIDADDLAEAVKQRKQLLADRQTRFERRRDAMRRAALSVLQELALPKWEHAEFTISISEGRDKVIITDDKAIPDALCRITREPDKTAIGRLLKANTPVRGATLGNAEPFLSLRAR